MSSSSPSPRFDGRVVLAVRSDSSFGRATVERLASEGASVHAAEGEPDGDGAAVRGCIDRFGRLDILVVPPPDAAFEAFPRASMDNHRTASDMVLRTAYFTTQQAVRAMGDRGRICIAAPRRPDSIPAGASPPATTIEGGLIALVRLLAVEVAPKGVAVNGLCPIGHRVGAAEVAAALAFLASSDASYVSGAFLPVGR
jgi:NAD(P)-dependent dehydrogenase (short-subunit alcohol dehydrogenase family)